MYITWKSISAIIALVTVSLALLVILTSIQFNMAPEPPSLQEIIELEWEKLPKGIIIFNPPKEMNQGEKERIEVRINKDISNISEDLTANLMGRGDPRIKEIKIAPQMTVELIGSEKSFDIKPLFTVSKQTFVGNYIQWDWDVTPLKSGNQTLYLCAYAVIEVPEYPEKYIKLPVMEEEIYVNVNRRYQVSTFIDEEWKWIISIITGLIGYFIGRRKSQGRTLFPSENKKRWWQFWK